MRMLSLRCFVLAICFFAPLKVSAQDSSGSPVRHIIIAWQDAQPEGFIEITNGNLVSIEITKGTGSVRNNRLEFASTTLDARINLTVGGIHATPGSGATLITVNTRLNPFSFFLRDLTPQHPIFIPDYHVAVTVAGDDRSFAQIARAVAKAGGLTCLQQIEREPEETYASAALRTRNQPCPTWLGISRDMRIFELSDRKTNPGSEMDMITPRNASRPLQIPEIEGKNAEYGYLAGRGQGVAVRLSRRLEEGVLPILHTTMVDGDIEYQSTAFVSPEASDLTPGMTFGTDWLVADASSGGHMFTKEQEELVKPKLDAENGKSETTILYYRVEATNKARVPRYAWFKTAHPGASWWKKSAYSFNRTSGFSSFSTGRVFCISRLNGAPLPDEEVPLLLKPGEKAIFEFLLPHSPIPMQRALALANQSFDARHEECRKFWNEKLEMAARITVPELRINEMLRAGLAQLDLTTYGIDPDSILAPTIGVYSPIGTESAPIIQFYNSAGLADIARRSLEFFIAKQHDDGMIQNFGGYQVESGAALWTMGEYVRYTGDTAWVKRVKPHLLRAADFLLRWREANKRDELNGNGYGMISGKVADPEDHFHQFMLNAYAYLGLNRTAEMLEAVDPVKSRALAREAQAWKEDIRLSLATCLAHSPAVPLGDGRWVPTVPPWTEAVGPRALHVRRDTYFSHGTITTPDVLLGPLYLTFCEVLSPEDPVSRMMLDYITELFLDDNAAFSQPYYSRHDWVELKRGMVKPFLKTYYNTFAALADRETYTFWEHLFQVSPHKTHEQAWFLMQTRWMLYLEDGQTLRLLPGIPRGWLGDGKEISLENVRSYFGPLSLRVRSHARSVEASLSCQSGRHPGVVVIRLPHPEGKKAVRVTGGAYDPATESVTVSNFTGSALITVDF
jgi:hypothetical protein